MASAAARPEAVAAALAQVERLNPELNAYLHVDAEGALAAARAAAPASAEQPLAGMPICVKDVIDVAGMPTTAGAAGWSRQPRADAVAVARLRAAGAIFVGKGNTNEFAYGIDGKNPHRGDCRNPHDPARMTGGSSSGPAAATAAGMAWAGIGTDTTGSIRMPASLCGVVGIRPTRGLVPTTGVVPLCWSYDTVGPLASTVTDAALLLDVLAGRIVAKPPAPDAGGVRLGLATELLALAEEPVAMMIRATAEALGDAGAALEERSVPDPARATAVHRIVQAAEAAAVHAPWFEDQRDRYAPEVRARLEAGRRLSAEVYLRAQRHRRLYTRDFATAMDGLDAMIAPASPVPAPPLDATELTIGGVARPLRPALLSCLLPISQLDCPAVVVPIGALEGLPVGIQLIGRPGCEAVLLRLAAAVEEMAGGSRAARAEIAG
ncbi:MAG TPA: amidase [Solirubrobacterales bacterium]|jgi:aspartyl-tRNA(Asn)/glutamyl-tRNA(Gln) amidotransferase subunit A